MNAQAKIEAGVSSAYVAAFAEIEAAAKDAKNPHFKSKYADLGSVIGAIKPALIKHGLALTQPCQPSEDGVTVRTILHHGSGETLDLGSLFVPANKRDAQGFGSALTYARRYALVSAFCVPTEDDDGNSAAASMGAAYEEPRAPAKGMPDDEYSRLTGKMKLAGVAEATLLDAYKVRDLRMISQSQYADAIKRLDIDIAEKSKSKAPAGFGETADVDFAN